jgi:hypothetical protein
MARAFLLIVGLIVLSGYSYAEWRGLTIQTPQRTYIPHGLRSASHGGYRSYWSSGFHGGK